MKMIFTGFAVVVALTAGVGFAQTAGQGAEKGGHDHAHGHSHAQDSRQQEIYKGYFPDAWIEARALSDWEGDWQSVFPLLQSGALDPVMAGKAEHGDKSAAEYRAYYEIGYRTDVDRIEIDGGKVTFHGPAGAVSGQYVSDGHEVLTYAKGNRGVRFIFRKAE